MQVRDGEQEEDEGPQCARLLPASPVQPDQHSGLAVLGNKERTGKRKLRGFGGFPGEHREGFGGVRCERQRQPVGLRSRGEVLHEEEHADGELLIIFHT